jgi:hypothetical protein
MERKRFEASLAKLQLLSLPPVRQFTSREIPAFPFPFSQSIPIYMLPVDSNAHLIILIILHLCSGGLEVGVWSKYRRRDPWN